MAGALFYLVTALVFVVCAAGAVTALTWRL